MELEKLVNEYLGEVRATMTENTFKSYRKHLEDFLAFCKEHGVVDAATWNGKETRAYRGWLLAKGFKPKTVNVKLSTLRAFFDFLVDEQVVRGNPITSRAFVREERTAPKFLTEAELRKVDNALETIRRDVALLFRTMLATGLRIGEALGLKSEDILEIDGGVFVKVRGKGNKERITPVMDEFVAKELLRLKRKEGKIFGFSRSLALYYADVIKKKTGISFHSHRLRHTVATKLLNSGVTIDTVQMVLGHASISTTRRYAQTSPEQVRKLAVKVK